MLGTRVSGKTLGLIGLAASAGPWRIAPTAVSGCG